MRRQGTSHTCYLHGSQSRIWIGVRMSVYVREREERNKHHRNRGGVRDPAYASTRHTKTQK